MPADVMWYVENRIVYIRFHGVITPEEITQQQAENRQLILQGEPPVHMIVDQTDLESYPVSVKRLRDAFNVNPQIRERLGFVITISPSTMTRMLSSIISQISGVNNRQFDDLARAIRFLQQADQTLPELSLSPPAIKDQHD